MSDFELALIHYRMAFPDKESLGKEPEYANWKKEYDRVAGSGLSAVLFLQSSSETGSATAQRNFDQKVLLHALLVCRGELDSEFRDKYLKQSNLRPQTMGFLVEV